MTNYKRYGKQAIYTVNFSAYCAVYDNRSGFVHECDIFYDGGQVYAKCQYYNRTWESYDFQSVIYKAIEKMPKRYRDEARAEFDAWGNGESEKMAAKFEVFKKNFESLTAEQKKHLESVTVTDKTGFDSVCGVVGMMAALNGIK